MKVEIIRYPDAEDWRRCYRLALNTVWKDSDKEPSEAWKKKIIRSMHSPIRTLMFTVALIDVPYWVSVHFSRHKIGVEHYVTSQRNDRQDMYDRNSARQDAPVVHIMDINAEAVIGISKKRMCKKAAKETREAWEAVCSAIMEKFPYFEGELVPPCKYGRCTEFVPCSEEKK